jgi:hypothetical protein
MRPLLVMDLLDGVGDDTHQVAWRGWSRPFGMDVAGAWAQCPRGSWLLMMASALGVEPSAITCASVTLLEDFLLPLVPELAVPLAPALKTLRGAALMQRPLADANAVAQALDREAAADAVHAQTVDNADARSRFLRWGLARRAVANTAGELVEYRRHLRSYTLWPTAADLIPLVAASGGLPRTRTARANAVHALCADVARSMVPGVLVRAVAGDDVWRAGQPRWLVVRFEDAAHWKAFRDLWMSLAQEFQRGLFDPADAGWRVFLHHTNLDAAAFHRVLMTLGANGLTPGPAQQTGEHLGRVGFHVGRGAHASSTVANLAAAFGLTPTQTVQG